MPTRADEPQHRRVRRIVVVRGRVQGVGFRWAAARDAERRGISGWVRNRPDGSVEAAIEGPTAAIEGMLAWLRVGPPGAAVTSVESTASDAGAAGADSTGFSIR